jgi:hypothetical protein
LNTLSASERIDGRDGKNVGQVHDERNQDLVIMVYHPIYEQIQSSSAGRKLMCVLFVLGGKKE